VPDFIPVVCPHCKARMRAPVQLAGHTAKCKRCRQPIVVQPEQLREAEPVVSTPPEPRGTAVPAPSAAPSPIQVPASQMPPWVGVAIVGVAVGVTSFVLWKVTRPDQPRPAEPGTFAPRVVQSDPAAEVKESFAKLAYRMRDRLTHYQQEKLLPSKDFGLDGGSLNEMNVETQSRYDLLTPIEFDIQATSSLTAPYVGVVRFGLRLSKKVVASRTEYLKAGELKLSAPLDYRGRGEATFRYRNGRWEFAELKYITDSINLGEGIDPIKDLSSAIFAHEIENSLKGTFGKSAEFPAAKNSELVKLVSEAANE
jgi:hypothetical protein